MNWKEGKNNILKGILASVHVLKGRSQLKYVRLLLFMIGSDGCCGEGMLTLPFWHIKSNIIK